MVLNNKILVSIVIISYNSSKYILETLESVKNQTYENIELIITDDGSTDTTVEICRNWIEKNNDRFVRLELLTIEKNSGIATNCNRGFFNTKGEWIKGIAGDDLLLPDCIAILLESTLHIKETIIFSKMITQPHSENLTQMFDLSYTNLNNSKNQLRYLLKGNYLPAPSLFIKSSTFFDLNGFDERFLYTEDYPFWIKALKKGYRMIFLDIKTVIYRVHQESISSSSDSNPFFKTMLKSLSKFRFKVLLPLQIKHGMLKYALLNIKSILYFLYYSIKTWKF